MSATVIIDYQLCNLDSIARAVEALGGDPLVTRDPAALPGARRIILPGVGSFGAAMANLRSTGMDEAIRSEVSRRAVPFLGICLGMQLLADQGDEGGTNAGLGLIPGRVERMQSRHAEERIPHIGWNEVEPRFEHPAFAGILPKSDFYFVHSYHFVCAPQYCLAETPYCGGIAAAIVRDNVIGVQFHPEKSQKTGFKLLGNFIESGSTRC